MRHDDMLEKLARESAMKDDRHVAIALTDAALCFVADCVNDHGLVELASEIAALNLGARKRASPASPAVAGLALRLASDSRRNQIRERARARSRDEGRDRPLVCQSNAKSECRRRGNPGMATRLRSFVVAFETGRAPDPRFAQPGRCRARGTRRPHPQDSGIGLDRTGSFGQRG